MARLRTIPWLLCLAAGCAPAERPGVPPQHVWLLTFDHLRTERLSAAMYRRDTTFAPTDDDKRRQGISTSLDELVAEGVFFAEAFAPEGRPLPSLASLMTGTAPLEHGCLGEQGELAADVPTLAERFAAAGYDTVAFVSRGEELAPLRRGFSTFESAGADGALEPDTATLAAAATWLDAHDFGDGRGVFLWTHLAGLRPPVEVEDVITVAEAQALVARYADPAYSGPARTGPGFQSAAHASEAPVDPADRRYVSDLYDADLRRTHELLRKFLDYAHYATQTSGALDRTALVVAGTCGMELGERHGYFGAAKSPYENALRVPLVLRHPDSLTGARVLSDVVELRDVAPTLVDWFELPPGECSGRSLLALTDSYVEREFEGRPAVAVGPEGVFSVRSEEFRLVWNPRGAEPRGRVEGAFPVPEVSLFASPHDRWEQMDLAPQYPRAVEGLQAAARAWFEGLDVREPFAALAPPPVVP